MTTHVQQKEMAKVRVSAMYEMYVSGMTLEDVGQQYGISKQRVSELFINHGFNRRSRSYRKVHAK